MEILKQKNGYGAIKKHFQGGATLNYGDISVTTFSNLKTDPCVSTKSISEGSVLKRRKLVLMLK